MQSDPIGAAELDAVRYPRRARNTDSRNKLLARYGDDAIRIAVDTVYRTVYRAAATPSFIGLPVVTT
ncbi:MAG: hypothetical protein AB7H90_20055 [Alphaproteobacteria bacterium]